MKYQCAHRWAFSAWGGQLAEQEDALAPPVGHEVTVRVTHCGMCHSDLHLQAGGFDMGSGKLSSFERAGIKLPVTMRNVIPAEEVGIGSEGTGVDVGTDVVL